MATRNIKVTEVPPEPPKRQYARAEWFNPGGPAYPQNIKLWTTRVDKLGLHDYNTYKKLIKQCRFFYRQDPLAFSVLSKMVDLAINDLIIKPEKKLSKTEIQIFSAVKEDLLIFLRDCSREYLLSGLVVPEISLNRLGKKELREKGIQRIDSLMYPTDMWLRNSEDIEIKKPFLSSKESYFLVLPDEMVAFIASKGTYSDGTKDIKLYNEIVKNYPEFVSEINKGNKKVLLDNPLIVKGTTLTDSEYPVPFLTPALESLMHKRNLKRMDYSIAARVISAVLHVTAGNDEYPVTKDQEDVLKDLEDKFRWRENLTYDDVERVFTLFTNHTVAINWVFPEIEALLSDKKYTETNKDILISLGFPRILITGETERSFSSDPQVATLSPIETLSVMRSQLMPIIRRIYSAIQSSNVVVSNVPDVSFKPINLMSLQIFYQGLTELYKEGNLSRSSILEAYGYDFLSEMEKREFEQEYIQESGLQEFAPVPHSNEPGQTGNPQDTPPTDPTKQKKQKPQAPSQPPIKRTTERQTTEKVQEEPA